MISEEAIRQRSYAIWQREGCPEGKSVDHWLRAKAELEFEHHRDGRQATGYQTALFRAAEWQRSVVARPRICPPPQRTVAARVSREQPAA